MNTFPYAIALVLATAYAVSLALYVAAGTDRWQRTLRSLPARRLRGLLFGGPFALVLAACGGEGPQGSGGGAVCVPNASVLCSCPNGRVGAQVCEPDGRSLGNCACASDGIDLICGQGYTPCGAPDTAPPTDTVDGGKYEYQLMCVDTFADPNNCGGCGIVCGPVACLPDGFYGSGECREGKCDTALTCTCPYTGTGCATDADCCQLGGVKYVCNSNVCVPT